MKIFNLENFRPPYFLKYFLQVTINFGKCQDVGTNWVQEQNKGGFNQCHYTSAVVCALNSQQCQREWTCSLCRIMINWPELAVLCDRAVVWSQCEWFEWGIAACWGATWTIELLGLEPCPYNFCARMRRACGNNLRAGYILFSSNKRIGAGTLQGRREFKEIRYTVILFSRPECFNENINGIHCSPLLWAQSPCQYLLWDTQLQDSQSSRFSSLKWCTAIPANTLTTTSQNLEI